MSKKVSCLKDLLKKFGELKKLSPLPPVKEFNYLLMARGFVTSTHIIRVHCQNNRLEIANGIFRSLATKGSNVDSSFYTRMIIGLLKDDNVEEALRQMDNMEEKKIKPEDSAYHALFNWMCNNSRYKDAENLRVQLAKVRSCRYDNSSWPLQTKTGRYIWTVIMSKKVSCLKDLLKKFGELKKLSPLPPVKEFNYLLMARGFVTSTHIIRVHCQNNRLEIANGIFRSLATKSSNESGQ
ncbi:Pentatricopeptide repeat-containing protein, mitochondrial [Artemisia annua]|uniref:Pentatricopeptide repeat-containing protein, mitochondrial n=1 Tax=Artemisia annua TaxID=35608 RepID=A0A2U1N8R8_ARTAN|nr:Pentatricopeptide repeat-containing protein, mitochondrial [Artemisia annua]